MHAASRTLIPGQLQSLPAAHRCWHRMSHAACGECNSRHSWHWFPLSSLLPKAPFSQRCPGFLAKSCLHAAKPGEWKQKHRQSHKSRGHTSICFGMGVCSRISLESVPTSQVIRVKGNEQSNRWQTQMWEKNTHWIISNDIICDHSNFLNTKPMDIRHI